MGTQMEAVVLGWLILTLTGSPFLVGLISAARMGLNFLALFAGAIVDRLPRHRVLAVVEFIMASLGLLMLVLIISGRLEVWHIFAITVVAGMVRIFQMPAAQSLVADTLPQERIGNGAAFTTVGMNLAMIIGPLVGGVLYKAFGPKGAYIVIGSLYCLSGISALMIRAVGQSSASGREPVLRSVLEGLKYVKGEQILWSTLMIAVIINLAGWTVHTSLMPIFARDVLDTDSAGLGLLLFAFGVGAITGSAVLAVFRNLRNIGRFLIGAAIMWHVSILAFAASHSFYLSMLILFAMGVAFSATQVFMLTVLLRTTKAEFRGRIIGLRVLAIYAFSFGSVAAGTMAELWGAPISANIVGLTGIGLVIALAFFTPKLRQV
jgi:predicted MFS family arabinose efflux permease